MAPASESIMTVFPQRQAGGRVAAIAALTGAIGAAIAALTGAIGAALALPARRHPARPQSITSPADTQLAAA
jgi:hypothetical protein